MVKRNRPSRHYRNVRTKQGNRRILINPRVKRFRSRSPFSKRMKPTRQEIKVAVGSEGEVDELDEVMAKAKVFGLDNLTSNEIIMALTVPLEKRLSPSEENKALKELHKRGIQF